MRPAEVRLAVYFAAVFVSSGVVIPFFPAFLADRGFSGDSIALVLAAPQILRTLTILPFAAAVDRWRDPRVMLGLIGVGLLAASAAIGPAPSDAALLAASILMMVLMYALAPVADMVALRFQRARLADYGRVRLWGSASFIAVNLAAGLLIDRGGTDVLSWLIPGAAALALAAVLLVPPVPRIAAGGTGTVSVTGSPAFLAVLVAGALCQASHAALYGFATITFLQRGLGETTVGALWAVGVVAEILMFFLAGRLARLSAVLLVAGAGLGGVVRWTLFAPDLGLAAAFGLQAMHAFTFALGHAGMVRFIVERVPDGRAARAQGLYVMLIGIFTAVASVVAGRLWEAAGPATFLAMACVSALALAVLGFAAPALRRLPLVQPQSAGSAGKTVDPS